MAFVSHFYGISPLEVGGWKPQDVVVWYNEGMKIWEAEMKGGGCAWR